MDEIHTETVDVQADAMFCLDLIQDDDDKEADEAEDLPAQIIDGPVDLSDGASQGTSVLESAGGLPPFQLDQEALFRELIAQHQRRLYRFVIKYIDHPDDAADITQQAFVEAARTIASFRGDSKLSTWLFGIAMNMVRNYLIARYTVTATTFANIIKEMSDSLKGVASKIG